MLLMFVLARCVCLLTNRFVCHHQFGCCIVLCFVSPHLKCNHQQIQETANNNKQQQESGTLEVQLLQQIISSYGEMLPQFSLPESCTPEVRFSHDHARRERKQYNKLHNNKQQ